MMIHNDDDVYVIIIDSFLPWSCVWHWYTESGLCLSIYYGRTRWYLLPQVHRLVCDNDILKAVSVYLFIMVARDDTSYHRFIVRKTLVQACRSKNWAHRRCPRVFFIYNLTFGTRILRTTAKLPPTNNSLFLFFFAISVGIFGSQDIHQLSSRFEAEEKDKHTTPLINGLAGWHMSQVSGPISETRRRHFETFFVRFVFRELSRALFRFSRVRSWLGCSSIPLVIFLFFVRAKFKMPKSGIPEICLSQNQIHTTN